MLYINITTWKVLYKYLLSWLFWSLTPSKQVPNFSSPLFNSFLKLSHFLAPCRIQVRGEASLTRWKWKPSVQEEGNHHGGRPPLPSEVPHAAAGFRYGLCHAVSLPAATLLHLSLWLVEGLWLSNLFPHESAGDNVFSFAITCFSPITQHYTPHHHAAEKSPKC